MHIVITRNVYHCGGNASDTFGFNPFTTEGPAAGSYVNTVSSSDTWLIIITRNLPISIEVIRGDS